MGKMLKSLETYYQHKGISPLDFCCKHWQTCSEGAEKITQATGAFVGTEYEKGVLPRLLFLSLDPGIGDSEPNSRTVESIRRLEEEKCNITELKKQRHWHWYYTHELALTLLRKFRPDMTIQDSHLYFAHANSAKCSINTRKQARRKLFVNCQEYVGGEIAILKPDILVTQGKMARVAVEEVFRTSPEPGADKVCSYQWVPIGDNKQTLLFPTHHPRNGKFFQQKRDCFENWAEYVYRKFRK